MLCVYCGTRDATTEDHVVPQGLFAQAPPEGYIKVPACEPCNRGYSLDEEYFQAVALAEGTFQNTEANRVLTRWAKDHRTGKRRLTGLARRLMEAVGPVEAHSPGGIYLGSAPGVELETQRVNRVLEKILKGLFFHEFGRRLPDDITVFVEIWQDLQRLKSTPFAAALAQQPKTLGTVFSWRVFASPENPDFTVWAMIFYDAVLAVGMTGRRSSKEASKRLGGQEGMSDVASHTVPTAQQRRYERALVEYRNWLVKTDHQASMSFDKAVVALAGGAIGLSLTIMRPEAAGKPLAGAAWLATAWICLAGALVIGLVSFLVSRAALRTAIRQVDARTIHASTPGGGWTTASHVLDVLAAALVSIGITFLVYTAWLNVGRLS